jgi:hypothetical protein
MMPSIIPAEGDNLTHSTHTHRSEDGSLSPNYVNRYSIGKGAKKVRTRIPHRISGNNNDLQRLSSGVIGIQAVTALGSQTTVNNLAQIPRDDKDPHLIKI